MTLRKKFFAIALPTSLIGVSFLLAHILGMNNPFHIPTINYDEQGFHPETIIINEGDTVLFRNLTDKPFWPASDSHPTHHRYSAFDPQKPIAPHEVWLFTFIKSGSWDYHNHLAPRARGLVVVKSLTENAPQSCEKKNDSRATAQHIQECYLERIRETLNTSGLDAAFTLFGDIRDTDPLFAADCHDAMHLLGAAAYQKFKHREKIPENPNATSCGYGFYHGFIEAMFQFEGSLTNAVSFCESLGKAPASSSSATKQISIRDSCYHGIGHGVFDNEDATLWGNDEAMTAYALRVCDELVSDKGLPLRQCATGVFNALGNSYRDPKHAFRLYQSEDHPLRVCTNRKEPYGETCYIDISLAYIEKKKLPLQEAIAFLGAIPHKEGAEYAVFGYVDNEIRKEIKEFDAQKWGSICATMPNQFVQSCIKGVVVGLLIWKSPEPVLDFCLLPEIEHNSDYCRKEFFGRLSALYSSEEKAKICGTLPPAFQNYCR